MGGNVSHEFMVPAASGEDIVSVCPKCKLVKPFNQAKEEACHKCKVKLEKVNCVEVGHIFKLGVKYSLALGANFLDAGGRQKPVIMGCYGIGVSRMIAAIIEQNYDTAGIIWPDEVTPYKVVVLPLDVTDKKIMEIALDIYNDLEKQGITTLLDDRDERAGVKFKDADLLGISLQLIIGKESLKNSTLELKVRRSSEKFIDTKEAVLKKIKGYFNG